MIKMIFKTRVVRIAQNIPDLTQLCTNDTTCYFKSFTATSFYHNIFGKVTTFKIWPVNEKNL